MIAELSFYTPTQKFIDWLKSLDISGIIEIGAGFGPIQNALKNTGVACISIDIFPKHTGIYFFDALRFTYETKHFPIIARPSHGEWVQKTVEKATKESSVCLYIGLEKNIKVDFDKNFLKQSTRITHFEDKEHIYLLFGAMPKQKPATPEFHLINKESPFWAKLGEHAKHGEVYYNINGGFQIKGDQDIIETTEAEDWNNLDFRKTCLYNPNGEGFSGWLDRSGRFFACGYMEHDDVIGLVFNKSVQEAEEEGWIRCHSKDHVYSGKRPSVEQKNFLSKRGFEIDLEDL